MLTVDGLGVGVSLLIVVLTIIEYNLYRKEAKDEKVNFEGIYEISQKITRYINNQGALNY